MENNQTETPVPQTAAPAAPAEACPVEAPAAPKAEAPAAEPCCCKAESPKAEETCPVEAPAAPKAEAPAAEPCCCKAESPKAEEACPVEAPAAPKAAEFAAPPFADDGKFADGSKAEAPAGAQENHFERRERPVIEITQKMLDDSVRTLETMLNYLGLEGSVRAEKRTAKINLLVASHDAGRIIGRKGQSLESLQLLVNRIMQKANQEFPKVYIDIDGYSTKNATPPPEGKPRRDGGNFRGGRGERSERSERQDRPERAERSERQDRPERSEHFEHSDRPARFERSDRFDRFERPARFERSDRPEHHGRDEFADADKEEVLRQQAKDAAIEVRRWGEPVTLPPMNSHDRRIIHITLENEEGIATDSQGDGAMKSVVVSLKNKEQ